MRRVSSFTFTSSATVSRLESRTSAPSDPGQRMVATIACVVYGIRPAELGLQFDDCPRWMAGALEEDYGTQEPWARSSSHAHDVAPVLSLPTVEELEAERTAARLRHPTSHPGSGVEWGGRRTRNAS